MSVSANSETKKKNMIVEPNSGKWGYIRSKEIVVYILKYFVQEMSLLKCKLLPLPIRLLLKK